ncbi:tautomerase family protein [Gluconobacter wancherniae]|uniref:tautomerase family protein n=1 Tax=Gluconobacter wancherniae TaxID=1307955 RepID=UPI0030AED5B5
MPHIIVKLWPGKSEQQKQRLTDAITQQVTAILGYTDDAVSVGFEEVASSEWRDHVYRPDIQYKAVPLYKSPKYCR